MYHDIGILTRYHPRIAIPTLIDLIPAALAPRLTQYVQLDLESQCIVVLGPIWPEIRPFASSVPVLLPAGRGFCNHAVYAALAEIPDELLSPRHYILCYSHGTLCPPWDAPNRVGRAYGTARRKRAAAAGSQGSRTSRVVGLFIRSFIGLLNDYRSLAELPLID